MDTNTTSTSHAQPPYGRACINCARAKSKCIASTTVDVKCERCHRLNKECQSPPAVRKRRIVKNTTATKTARLEEKLDGLVSFLHSAAQSLPVGAGNIVPTAQVQLSPESLRPQHSYPKGGRSHYSEAIQIPREAICYPVDDLGLHPPILLRATSNVAMQSVSRNVPTNYIPRGFEPPMAEADENLKTFRTCRLKHFPFINWPESVSSQELRQERPFLWFCIMAVSSKSSVQQMAFGEEIRSILGRQVLVESEKTLDLLLGLLTYLAWGQCIHHKNGPIVSSLMQLAIALLCDLGLNKSPPKESPHMMLNYDARGCPRPFNPRPRTMDERRAAIACFLLSSVISQYFQKLDPLRWTAYLENCLQMLAENRDCQTDSLLASLVRLQLITEKIAHGPWYDGSVEPLTSRAPAAFYLKALEAQLEDCKRTIPPELQQNETLLLHLHNTSLAIHELALSRSPQFPDSPSSARLDSLYACLHATKSWFDHFLSIPSAAYIGFPSSIVMQMAHSIIILYRLSTLDDACWDRGLVRETLDFSVVLDEMLQRMAGARGAAGMEDNGGEQNDTWYLTERRVRAVRSWWDARVAAEEGRTNGGLEGAGVEVGGEVPGMEFWDDSWLDILGLRDYWF